MISSVVLIGTETGREEEVFRKLRELTAVKEISLSYGKYDIFAKIVVERRDELTEIIANHVRKIDGISFMDYLVLTDKLIYETG